MKKTSPGRNASQPNISGGELHADLEVAEEERQAERLAEDVPCSSRIATEQSLPS